MKRHWFYAGAASIFLGALYRWDGRGADVVPTGAGSGSVGATEPMQQTLAALSDGKPRGSGLVVPAESDAEIASAVERFAAVAVKAVPTNEERREMEATLQSRARIDAAFHDLTVDPHRAELPPSSRRLKQVGLLEAALRWSTNPELPYAVGAVTRILRASNLSRDLPEVAQRSVAGDKMELYAALLETNPAAADALYAEAQQNGTNLRLLAAVRKLRGLPLD